MPDAIVVTRADGMDFTREQVELILAERVRLADSRARRRFDNSPMPLDAILPLIREVGSLRERGEYGAAAELEERIRQPLTVAGRVLEPDDIAWQWWRPSSDEDNASLMVSAVAGEWTAVLTMYGDGPWITQTGRGPTIAAALADAQARYQAAIPDTLLRMGGLLREVTP